MLPKVETQATRQIDFIRENHSPRTAVVCGVVEGGLTGMALIILGREAGILTAAGFALINLGELIASALTVRSWKDHSQYLQQNKPISK